MTTERPDRGARALAERLAETIRKSDNGYISVYWCEPAKLADAILANGAVFLPDAAELERLRRIEAALDAVMESRSSYGRPLTDYMEFRVAAEARAALEPEGSAQG